MGSDECDFAKLAQGALRIPTVFGSFARFSLADELVGQVALGEIVSQVVYFSGNGPF